MELYFVWTCKKNIAHFFLEYQQWSQWTLLFFAKNDFLMLCLLWVRAPLCCCLNFSLESIHQRLTLGLLRSISKQSVKMINSIYRRVILAIYWWTGGRRPSAINFYCQSENGQNHPSIYGKAELYHAINRGSICK